MTCGRVPWVSFSLVYPRPETQELATQKRQPEQPKVPRKFGPLAEGPGRAPHRAGPGLESKRHVVAAYSPPPPNSLMWPR